MKEIFSQAELTAIRPRRRRRKDKTPPPPPNLTGAIGPRCANCSGWGKIGSVSTNGSIGGVSRCNRCLGTGVEPLNPIEQRELLERLRALERNRE